MSLTKSTSETGVGTDEGDNIFRHNGRQHEHGYDLPDWWIEESEQRHARESQQEAERSLVLNAS